MHPKVTLRWFEVLIAGTCAIIRRIASICLGIQDHPYQQGDDPVREDLLSIREEFHSAGAEEAVGRFTGRYVTHSVNTFKNEPDIPPDIEVRYTSNPKGRLIVRPNDPDDRRYVLVRGKMPTYEFPGYIWGIDAKKRGLWDDDNGRGKPCWWVPENCLTPMPEIRLKPRNAAGAVPWPHTRHGIFEPETPEKAMQPPPSKEDTHE